MINKKFFIRIRKIIILILFSSITSIVLFSCMPIISETLYADSPDFEKLSLTAFQKDSTTKDETYTATEFYTYHSMQKRSNDYAKYGLSENEQIKNLSDQSNLIYNCFWIVLIISLLTYIGLTLNAAQNFSSLSQWLMLIGCLVILFNFLVIFLYLRFIETANISENISLAYITPDIPIKYFHLIMIPSVTSLIGSLAYTGYVLPSIVKQKRIDKKQHLDTEEILVHPIENKKQELLKKIPLMPVEPVLKERALLAETKKHEKLKEQWLKEQQAKQNRRKTFASTEIKTIIKQAPGYHQSIQRIPPETVTDKASSGMQEEFSGSREHVEEKYFQEKKTPSDHIEEKHRRLTSEKNIDSPFSFEKKQLRKEKEPFKSEEKLMKPAKDESSQKPTKEISVESFEQPLPSIVKREIIDKKQENIKKTPLMQVEPVLKEEALLAETKKHEKIKEQWVKEQQAKQNIRKTFESKEAKTITEETPGYHQSIQRIPPKTVTNRASLGIQEEPFGSREHVEEKYFQEKKTPSDHIEEKHRRLTSEKNIDSPFSFEKKQLRKEKEPFKSEEKLMKPAKDESSQKPTKEISVESFEQPLPSIVKREIIDKKQENIKKTPLMQVEPVLKEEALLAETKKHEKIKEQWVKEQQAKQNIRKTFESKEAKTITEETPGYHQSIQRIPPKTVTNRASLGIQEEPFGSREPVEEKYFQKKKIPLEKRKIMMENLFEAVEKTPSDHIEEKHEHLASEKNIDSSFSFEKKQLRKQNGPFKSEEKLMQSTEDEVSQKPSKAASAGSFEQALFSAIEKKKKERKKHSENKQITEK